MPESLDHQLYGRPAQTPAEVLREIADYLGDENGFDTYGEGEYLQAFEQDIAKMFGKAAAVYMPSGTMAQQIALRIWCDRDRNPTVAMHPSAHLETAELLGYQHLHHLRRLQFGVPEMIEHRLPLLEDFQKLGCKPGAILLELPCRPLGGMLPTWDELSAISEWARSEQIALHMDGARIWQCRPHFRKSFAEIAELFDSVYVSFYKDIGGMFGCILLGEQSFIDESRVWLRRMGGNLINQGTGVVSAKMGMERVLPKIDQWVAKAQELAAIFNEIDGVRTNPVVPHASMFQLFLEGAAEELTARNELATKITGTKLFGSIRPSVVPSLAMTEVHVSHNAMRFDVNRIKPFMANFLKSNG